jgi:hypothetical protein
MKRLWPVLSHLRPGLEGPKNKTLILNENCFPIWIRTAHLPERNQKCCCTVKMALTVKVEGHSFDSSAGKPHASVSRLFSGICICYGGIVISSA